MTDTVIHTESATSKYVNVVEEGTELRVHYNDTGTGNEALVLLHGSGRARPAGRTSIATWTHSRTRAIA